MHRDERLAEESQPIAGEKENDAVNMNQDPKTLMHFSYPF